MQPRRPHGQRAPPRRTTTWPISPAGPRPSQGLPSSTMPPPTPVPQKTPRTESRVAGGAELELRVGRDLDVVAERPAAPRPPASSCRAGRCLPVAEVAHVGDGARVASSTSPGEPTPTPASAPGVGTGGRGARAARPPSRRRRPRGRRRWAWVPGSPSALPSASTTTAWIFVPPRSMPPRMLIARTLNDAAQWCPARGTK